MAPMQIDYNTAGRYVVTTTATRAASITREHDFTAVPDARGVLFSDCKYAAAGLILGGCEGDAASVLTLRCGELLRPITDAIDASWAYDSAAHLDLPPDRELWPFQRASAAYCLATRNAIVGDVPGLGKTNTAIAVANTMQAERCIVVCPASIRRQWADRILGWTTLRKPIIHVVEPGCRSISLAANWLIISYDLLRRPEIAEVLANGRYDLLVLDEAHYVKSADAARTRAIFGGGRDRVSTPIAHCAGKTLALTGTPLPNRPREIYPLLRALAWDAVDFMSQEAFDARYNPYERKRVRTAKGYKFVTITGTGYLHELQARLRGNAMVRHVKDEEISRQIGRTGYPVYDLVYVMEDRAVRQALAAERLLDFDPDSFTGRDAKFDGQVETVRRQMGEALAPHVVAYVDQLIEGGEDKIVVFAVHRSVLDILAEGLHSHGVVRLDGRSSPRQREQAIARFINDPEIGVFLGNSEAAGTGVDGLQRVCNHAVIAQPAWVPKDNEQCFARLDRGGQTRTVLGDIVVAPGSIAERILASALRKMKVIETTLDGGGSGKRNLLPAA